MSEHSNFVGWWTANAHHIAEATAKKCDEYGSNDLYGIGHNVARIAGQDINDAAAFEIGVLFYVLGKIERAMSAAERGNTASDDTWLDLHVYAGMVLAHRAGVWFTNKETDK
jgi:hypothetical protein